MNNRMIGMSTVSGIGLGGMGLSIQDRPDEGQALKTIHAALDEGITFIDTADCYCLDSKLEHGHNERLVAKALATWSGDPDAILVGTKGGKRKPSSGPWPTDGRPEYIKDACEASLKSLGVEAIGLYQLHQPDPNVPFAESLGALNELITEGKVLQVGISNVTIDQITEAMAVVPIVSVQNQLSPLDMSAMDVVEYCTMFGVAFLAWSPLGGLSRARNIGVEFPALQYVAGTHGYTPQQVALAWLLELSPVVIPIPSARRPETITSIIEACDIELTFEDLAMLNAGIPEHLLEAPELGESVAGAHTD